MSSHILKAQSPLLNGGNAVGNLNSNGGSLTDQRGPVANAHNVAFSGSGSQAALNQPNKGLFAVKGGATSPSSVQTPLAPMAGGGRRRRRSKTSRRSRKNRHSHSRSRKYGRKRGSKRVTRSRSRSRSRRGGYTQYMTGISSSFGQIMPGYPLTSRMSALANPTPFRPYQKCPGGL
jgi:hypothetical protein